MNWISFKEQLPEMKGSILIKCRMRQNYLDKEEKYVNYYDILTAEPMEIYSKFVWCKKIEGESMSARVVHLLTNEYLSDEKRDYYWIRLPFREGEEF